MYTLRIEHVVQNFDAWKKAFDSDPIGRKRSGVRQYRIFRPVDDDNYVVVDLEFDSEVLASEALEALRKLWKQVEGKVMFNPETRILRIAESREL